jgi:ADP-ribose pyrophosphatase YjhB (NUDIX family)
MSDYTMPKPLEYNFCPTCGSELALHHDGQDHRPHCAGCLRFFYKNPIPAACCFVTKPDGSLLYARRAVEPCLGMWTLPGGFVELDETTEEAALRELQEETNLRATSARLVGVSTKQSPRSGAVLVLGYHIEDWEGEEEMRPDTDASELRFFAPHERPQLPFSTHQELLELFDRGQERNSWR